MAELGGRQRWRSTVRWAVVAATAIGSTLVVADGEVSAATAVVAAYEMNEGSNASVLVDSGPYGLDGTIGSDVVTGATYGGATGLRWRWTRPSAPPAMPERIVNVPSDPALNPDGEDYAVEFRYRTTQNFGNVIQKGQNKSPGGYWKFEQPSGFMTCLYKGGNGQQRAVKSKIATNDGQWHVIRCERSDWGIRLFIDGVQVRQLSGPTGVISNTKPLSIGGKSECDQIDVTCDYFTGDIDYVHIEKSGTGNPPPPPPPPPPPDNESPVASFTTSCAALQCSFDSGASNDPDGSIVQRSWNFGDGASGSGVAPDHTYTAPGTYQVTLTVEDDGGATDQTQRNVSVGSVSSGIDHVASATRSGWSNRPRVTLPSLQGGDTILLFMTAAKGVSMGEPTGSGWTAVETVSGNKALTRVWAKTASPGDGGDEVSVNLSSGAKYNASAVVYRGVDGVSASDGDVNTTFTDTRVTPAVGVPDSGSWGVSFWMHRDSSSSSLDAPSGVATRVSQSQSGGGRATVLIADSAGGVGGSYGGLAAIAPSPSTFGITITVILRPA
jgi:PKD repeat protein